MTISPNRAILITVDFLEAELRLVGKKEWAIHAFGILELCPVDSADARGVGPQFVQRKNGLGRMRCKPEQVGRTLGSNLSWR